MATLASLHHGLWDGLTPYLREQWRVDALLVESVTLLVLGPLAGVATARRRTTERPDPVVIVARCGAMAVAFAVAGAMCSWVAGPSRDAALVVPAALTIGAAALALTAVGAAGACLVRHPLDAAASALFVSVLAGVGALAAGPLVADASARVVDAALLVSPVVAAASAANVDLLRGDLLYRFSPIAHSQFQYPAWPAACAVYAAVAAVGLAVVVVASNRGCRMVSAERITL